jgi:hypothetical protein
LSHFSSVVLQAQDSASNAAIVLFELQD